MPRRFGSDTHWLKLATSRVQAVGLKDDGSLWNWGLTQQLTNLQEYSTPTRIGTATDWVQAAAGVRECLALKNDGSLWAWGYNDDGSLGNGTTNLLRDPTRIGPDHDWQAIAASQMTSFAVKSNGTLWVWGYLDGKTETAPRQLDTGTNWVEIAASESDLMALKSDGTIWRRVISSRHSETMTQIGRDHDWKTVDGRLHSYFAAKQDGSWWAWGFINGTNAASPERLPPGFAAWSYAPRDPRSSKFPPGTALVLTADGGLWTTGTRIGTDPAVWRWRIGNFLGPVARHGTTLGNIFKAKADETPYRLWELPAEVRRSLGAAPPVVAHDLNTHVTTNGVRSDKTPR
jgi:alpha-tubulin suppressor-like RCC1 family protein